MRSNVTAQELFDWLKTHDFVWYQPPMDVHPSRVYVRSKLKRWKRTPDRFEVTVEKPGLLKFRIDNGHLDRIRMPEENEWKKKLHPGRFSGMSGKMAAIVGFICGETYTNPAISELIVTTDGCVLAAHVGDCGANDFLGGESDLKRNWTNLLDAAGLNAVERAAAISAYESKVVTFA